MVTRPSLRGPTAMRLPKVLSILVVLWPGAVASAPPWPDGGAQAALAPVSLRPPSAGRHRCGGACLKSGSLSWSCPANLECALSCATAPPVLRCLPR